MNSKRDGNLKCISFTQLMKKRVMKEPNSGALMEMADSDCNPFERFQGLALAGWVGKLNCTLVVSWRPKQYP